MYTRGLCAGLFVWLAALQPAAAEESAPPDPYALQFHAFASQGFLLSTKNNYLAKSKDGSFEFTEVGLNLTKPLGDSLRMGAQLFSRKIGPTGSYLARFDWFYIDYRFKDQLSIRLGRVKLPFGLYNEINDVDSGRVAVLLPQSIYPIQNRDYLLAVTGGEVYGRLDLGSAGALEYRLYGGTIQLDASVPLGAPYRIRTIGVPYLIGGRALWETPLPGLRAGGSLQALRIDADLQFDAAYVSAAQMASSAPLEWDGVARLEAPVVIWVASIEYAARDLLLAAEYSRWHVKAGGPDGRLLAPTDETSERMYALATYRFNGFFHPGAYYSLLFPATSDRHGKANQLHDVAVTLRFDLHPNWLFKLEGHFMHGTAGLDAALNGGHPRERLTRNWTVLLAKTTAYF
jgi:hypothetical protein